MDDLISRQAAIDEIKEIYEWHDNVTKERIIEHFVSLPSAQPEQHGRVFKEIVVEYPTYSTYPEYEGKPYFSIKYTENGQEFIGYGTYKPEVLSEYLKEYFMSSAQPELCEGAVSRRRLLSDLKELIAAWEKYPVMAEQIKGVEAAIGYVESIPSAQPETHEKRTETHACDLISRQAAIELVKDVCDAIMSGCESWYDPETEDEVYADIREVDAILKCNKEVMIALRNMPSAQPEQRWIPCGKCIHADGKHRWCKVLDRTINEDYFCYWAEPFRGEGEADEAD